MRETDLDDVAVFAKVVEQGGFAKAARELGVPTSTVSRRLARLEASLATRLLHRTTRQVRPTAEGQRFFEEVAPLVTRLTAAVRRAPDPEGELRGLLRVTAPNDLVMAFLAEAVADFARMHPAIELDLVVTPRLVNLIDEGIDLAIRAGALSDSSLIARRIGDLESKLHASPDYVSRRGTPRTLGDLARHDVVLFRTRASTAVWRLEGPRGPGQVEVRGRVRGDELGFVRAAALAGAGIALLPRVLVVGDLEAGRLVPLLPAWEQAGGALSAVYPSTRYVPRKVSVFRDFVSERYHALLGRRARRARG